jgi:hypothetical protein
VCCAEQADNPGTWMLHCHIWWHFYMGQIITFVEAPDQVGPAPPGLPKCPDTCTYNTAPWVSAAAQRSLPSPHLRNSPTFTSSSYKQFTGEEVWLWGVPRFGLGMWIGMPARPFLLAGALP